MNFFFSAVRVQDKQLPILVNIVSAAALVVLAVPSVVPSLETIGRRSKVQLQSMMTIVEGVPSELDY